MDNAGHGRDGCIARLRHVTRAAPATTAVERALCAADSFACQPEILSPTHTMIYRIIATQVINKADVPRITVRTGAVTLIQRFGRALNS